MMGSPRGTRRGWWNIASGGRGWGRVGLALLGFLAALSVAAFSGVPQGQDPELPIREIRGAQPGPTVAFVAGVHGGKRAAVAALDSLATRLNPAELRGTILLVGPANLAGYRAALAQTSPDDGLNLNRVFPGRADGRPTERLAARIMREVVARADYLVDMHGSDGDEAVGRFAYAARPGVRPAIDSAALELSAHWLADLVVWDSAGPRTLAESRFLQTAAHLSGVPAITVFEPGSMRDDERARDAFIAGMLAVVQNLGMTTRVVRPFEVVDGRFSQKVYNRREIASARSAGAWRAIVSPGEKLRARELLGTLTDSLGIVDSLRATESGIVLHQRLPGRVAAGTPLVIYGVNPR